MAVDYQFTQYDPTFIDFTFDQISGGNFASGNFVDLKNGQGNLWTRKLGAQGNSQNIKHPDIGGTATIILFYDCELHDYLCDLYKLQLNSQGGDYSTLVMNFSDSMTITAQALISEVPNSMFPSSPRGDSSPERKWGFILENIQREGSF